MNKWIKVVAAATVVGLFTVCCVGERQSEGGRPTKLPPSTFLNGPDTIPEERCSPFADELSEFASGLDISSCRKLLPSDLKPGDYIIVQITVNRDGDVLSAAVKESTHPSKRFELCLLRLLKSIQFPPPPTKTTFEAGFDLSTIKSKSGM